MSVTNSTGKPRVILGLMTFGLDPTKGARITSLATYNTFLDRLQEAGYNEVDTARSYIGGAQEAFTREARWKERGLKLATKSYPMIAGTHKAEALTAEFETSLKELGTDCVDIFYLHAADRSVPFAETLEAVDRLHKAGKFVQLGLSNYTAFELAEIVMTCKYNNWVRPTIFQGMYNAITRSLEQELIPACRRYGLEVVVYNPLAGGILSGKYKPTDMPDEGRFSSVNPLLGASYRKRYFRDSTFEALAVIELVAKAHHLTLVEIGLRWLVHHSALNVVNGTDGIIIGVSSIEQLDQNLEGCQRGPLPEEVIKALDQAWLVAKAETPKYWQLDLRYTYNTTQALFGTST
ncbi:putative aflatoxin b1 aldehyde reductase-like protein [Xylariales sp. PMI_506]|nr:putative aflatoxin b1 aldehyde reductase-like protein [Xylariales sp. PMI_506]